MTTDMKDLGNPLRDIKSTFDEFIIPHRPVLWKYCFHITGSPWDAEDLVQDTLLRAFSSLSQIWQPINPKGFLFRIASNIWIDQCRKKKLLTDSIEIVGEQALQDEDFSFEVYGAIEELVLHLPPRQRAVILLVDVFQFKAQEAGEMIGCTEGAVKALLNRARVRIKQLKAQEKGTEEKQVITNKQKEIINSYIESFNRRDPDGIARLLDTHVSNDIVHIAQEYGKETVCKYSLADWAKDPVNMKAELHLLWGRYTIVQIARLEDSLAVYDLNLLQVESDKIVDIKDYYFCPEMLEAAAKELNMKAFPRKYVL
ncbi:RNA polymerase sigma factor [Bacillus sp. V3-13]|uniref:RNA polymerase sigma factor n=1 Tax=Bacillus sp. V3-13 TaxID=2053728 RepID=UPI0015E0CACD|nr:RNA polymerase sigma factor [Bacillus sp. V3-13]